MNTHVYFVGGDSVGKTEMAKDVELRYGIPRIHEGARAVLAEESLSLAALRVSVASANDFQRKVWQRQFELEKKLRSSAVGDRCLLDNLAYAATNARCLPELLWHPDTIRYAVRLRRDVVFLVRPQKKLRKRDGVRVLPTWEEQIALDAKIELLLKMFEVPFVEIAVASAAARTALVDWCLDARGFKKVKRKRRT